MSLEPDSLPRKCKKEFLEIQKRNQKALECNPDWEPTIVGDDCILHLFVSEHHWDNPSEKPTSACFGKPELSVQAVGGAFPDLSKDQLIKNIRNLAKEKEIKLVGAVSLKASFIFEKSDYLKFFVIHDPNPWMDKIGELHAQAQNHVQVLCMKRTEKQEFLWENCQVSVRPDEMQSEK